MEQEVVNKWTNLVAQISTEYARRYHMIDRSDIQQEIWLWFLTHESKLQEWQQLDSKLEVKLVAKSCKRAALKYCEKEKARTIGYDIADLHYYDKATVEMYLPYILSNDYQIPSELNVVNSESRVTKDPSEGNGWLAMWADISKGFDKLPEHHQVILRERFLDESRTYKAIGVTLSISEEAARKRVDRAIAALINKIGGESPWRQKSLQRM